MHFKRSFFVCLAVVFSSVLSVSAQKSAQPVGSWRSFLPYSSAIGLATNGNTLFTIGNQAFFVYNSIGGQMDPYSKVEGMSDIGMQCIGYDMATSTAVLVYTNGNVDLFKDNTFYNVPELKIKTIAGSKSVSEVYTNEGLAYLSTAIGIVIIDLAKQNVRETYEFNLNKQVVPVSSTVARGDSIFALTEYGLYKANRSSRELQNFQVWEKIDSTAGFKFVVEYGGDLFLSNDTIVCKVQPGGPVQVYRSPVIIERMDVSANTFYVSEFDEDGFNGTIKVMSSTGPSDSIFLRGSKPRQVVKSLDGSVWIADEFGGLLRYTDKKEFSYYTPTGPSNSNSFDIYARDNELWIAHGGVTAKLEPLGNHAGLSNYNGEKWKYLQRFVYHPFDTLSDFTYFAKDEVSGVIYAASAESGLFVLNPDGTYELFKQNSIIEPVFGRDPAERSIAGMAVDSKRNLWLTSLFSINQLYVKTVDNSWFKFQLPDVQFGGPVVVDDNDQIWFVSYPDKGGVAVYNYGESIADPSDDFSYKLVMGKGNGNLPSNVVNCIAKDNNNNMWIGTASGIGIVNSCSPPFNQSSPCEAEIPIVQYDQYAGYLFAGNNVRTIAVDGANRKWVGTDDGVWLLSPDAGKIVYRFTMQNSPLPSDRIQKISIDKITGEVYIGTEQGLVSFRSTATEGGTSNTDVVTFPNPVPSGYTGTIAIKGLVANADVRITDISGQLVYRTKALGGQAVWNGMDYKGRRPQSGVYLIFATDANGAETFNGKMVFLK
jgi:hypothetical protein